MGSLSSTPKLPQSRQAQAAQTPVTQPSQPQETPSQIAVRKQDEQSQKRIKSLLSRRRGRFGTIVTGLKGFLREVGNNARKTLLGE